MSTVLVTGDLTPLAAALRQAVDAPDPDGAERPTTVVHFDGYDSQAFLRLRRAATLGALRRAHESGSRFVLVTPRRTRSKDGRYIEALALAFGRAHDLDTTVLRAGSGEPRPWRPSACGVRRALPLLLAVVSAHEPLGMTGSWSSSPSSPSS